MRIGPVLEVRTSFQFGKHGIEIRIRSVGQFNSQFWVRNSYGTNKYMFVFNHNNSEILADPHEDQMSQTIVKTIAARSKKKTKPQKREPVDTPRIIPMYEIKWIDIESSDSTLAAYDVSKKMISLLRHNQTVQRENQHEEVQEGDISIVLIFWEQSFTSVLFRDTVDIISLILRQRTMCWFSVEYSITSTTSDAHSIFILLSTMDWYLEVKIWAEDKQYSCPLIRETKIMKIMKILSILTSLYHVERDTCTVHGRNIKTRYIGVDVDFAITKGLTFIEHDRMQISFKEHFQLIAFQKLKRLKTWAVLHEKSCLFYSSTTEDLIETRSRLHQREWWIEFYGWTTASLKTRPTVFWRSTTC